VTKGSLFSLNCEEFSALKLANPKPLRVNRAYGACDPSITDLHQVDLFTSDFALSTGQGSSMTNTLAYITSLFNQNAAI